MRRILPLLLLAALAAPSVHAQDYALDANAVVATVNGEAIKAGEYYHRLEWFRPDPNSAFAATPVGFQLLRQMISDRIIYQLAKSKGVAPTAPQIDARMADLYGEDPNLKARLADAGRSEAEVRQDMVLQEARFNLVTANVTITDQQVEQYYKANPAQFEEPKRYRLRIIAVGDDEGEKKVDDALKAGRPFADVAKELSLDVTTRSNGGEYGDVPETTLSDATRPVIGATAVGSATPWIRSADNKARVRFLVEAATPAKTVPLDTTLRRSIRRRLMLDRGTVVNNLGHDLDDATKAAKITITQPQFQKLYLQLLNRVKAEG